MNSLFQFFSQRGPGIALAIAIAASAYIIQLVETSLFRHAYIEALVIAIVLGILYRNTFGTRKTQAPGISFVAKDALEFAVMLLGASVFFPDLVKNGALLLAVIVGVVVIGLWASRSLARMLGLNPRLATLVAVGNAICGNSAIAAVAPVIKAEPEEVASSIAFTAVLGVIVVLTLPLLIPLLRFNEYQYGALAGLSVYAVPQVVAAAAQVSEFALKIATSVKLVRVLMLGPVVLFFSLRAQTGAAAQSTKTKLSFTKLVPWFIIGFVILATLRSTGLIPQSLGDGLAYIGKLITIAAMAALGLGVDIKSIRKAGPHVTLAVSGSLLVMLVTSVVLLKVLGITG